uniref:DUF4801 domain-containing protein n=1 Tax=Rhabditophanes sp. KR3021 TaxID=114890 RepID=A0AC35UA17_9BILA
MSTTEPFNDIGFNTNNRELLSLLFSNLEESSGGQVNKHFLETHPSHHHLNYNNSNKDNNIKQRRKSRVIRNFNKIAHFESYPKFENWLVEQKMWSVGTKNELKDRIIQNYRCKFSRKARTDCLKSIRLIKCQNEDSYTLEESDNDHDHSLISQSKEDVNSMRHSFCAENGCVSFESAEEKGTSDGGSKGVVESYTDCVSSLEADSDSTNDGSEIKSPKSEPISRFGGHRKRPSSHVSTVAPFEQTTKLDTQYKQNLLFKILRGEETNNGVPVGSIPPQMSRPRSAPVSGTSYQFLATFRNKHVFGEWFNNIAHKWIKKSKEYEKEKSVKYYFCAYHSQPTSSTSFTPTQQLDLSSCLKSLRITFYGSREEVLVEESLEKHNHEESAFPEQRIPHLLTARCQSAVAKVERDSGKRRYTDDDNNTENSTMEVSESQTSSPPRTTKRRKLLTKYRFKTLPHTDFKTLTEATDFLTKTNPTFKCHSKKFLNGSQIIYYVCKERTYTNCKKQIRIIQFAGEKSFRVEESKNNHNHNHLIIPPAPHTTQNQYNELHSLLR